jgi:hypothetical protein
MAAFYDARGNTYFVASPEEIAAFADLPRTAPEAARTRERWARIAVERICGRLNVSEGIETPQQEGTLILVEVITPLMPDQVLARFRPVDLQAVGLKESDVSYGTAVFVSSWAQSQSRVSPAKGLYALVNLNAESPDSGASTSLRAGERWSAVNDELLLWRETFCSRYEGCSYGGAAVAIRVVKRPAGGAGEPMLYVVESVVEPRLLQGDCQYVPRGIRRALHCTSLDSKGWEWQGDLFVKRPDAATNR